MCFAYSRVESVMWGERFFLIIRKFRGGEGHWRERRSEGGDAVMGGQ
jgi:hypothetical protein